MPLPLATASARRAALRCARTAPLAALLAACGPPEGKVVVPDLGPLLMIDAEVPESMDATRADAALAVIDSGPPLVFLDSGPPQPDNGLMCMSIMPEACNGVDDDCDRRVDEGRIIGNQCWARSGDCLVSKARACNAEAIPGCPAAAEGEACAEKPLTFAILSDYGSSNGGESIIADVIRGWTPDFVVTAGDNNLPSGAADTIDRNVGQYFGSFIGEYHGRFGIGADDNRFWPALGHADYLTADAQPYLDFFTLPGNERYYDVDMGVVHLFILDSNPQTPDGIAADGVQAQWLQVSLAASQACHKVIVFHHPPYSSASRGEANGGVPMRWPFKAWGASAVVSGHDRFYERLDVDGLPYFIVGYSGGADNHTFADPPRPESQFRFRDRAGALKVTATAQSVTYSFITTDGMVRDELPIPLACP